MSASHKHPETGISDQRTDRSGAVLVKIAKRMDDQELAEAAMNTFFSMEKKERCKTASFPTETPEDTILSRIYFEGQREKFAADEAAELDNKLKTFEILHGISVNVSMRPLEKKAAAEPAVYELLPNCKVACENELVQAGKDFSAGYRQLSGKDRELFAKNFLKAASEMGMCAEIPDEIKLYSGVHVMPREDMAEQIQLRKVAMERMGEDATGYEVLATQLRSCDVTTFSKDDLLKLAEAISFADEACGLEKSRSGRTIPDAWHSVLRLKTAEELEKETKLADDAGRNARDVAQAMSKSEIIGRFGPGALEEVEDDAGKIDTERLAGLIELFGGARQTEAEETSGGRGANVQ
nr:MAG TPA: hypothetical protein [Caudoviricetes sp.]